MMQLDKERVSLATRELLLLWRKARQRWCRTLRVSVSVLCTGFEGDPAANTLPANQRLEEPSRNYYPILQKCLHMYAHSHIRVHTVTLDTIILTILYWFIQHEFTPMSLKATTSDRLNKEQAESLRMDSPCHSFAVSLDNLLSGENSLH